MQRSPITLGPAQRRVLLAAGVLTLVLWLYPPVQRPRQIMNYPTPLDVEPTFRTETHSAHFWIWQLRPHQDVWYGMLIARTLGVWTLALVAVEALRKTRRSSTSA